MNIPCIAFIGAGNLTRSLMSSINTLNLDPEKIWISNRSPEKLVFFKKKYQIRDTTDNQTAANEAKIIILSVKPAQLATVANDIAPLVVANKTLIISLAAGVTLNRLAQLFGENTAIIRAMPNTPVAVGAGVTAFIGNKQVSATDKQQVNYLFKNSGHTLWADSEDQLDQITALAGSGPAYFFAIIEALRLAAEKIGLPKEIASTLSMQTAFGAAKMAISSNDDVSTLRKNVTSPGGVTEQALKALAGAQLEDAFTKTLQAGISQAKVLAKKNN